MKRMHSILLSAFLFLSCNSDESKNRYDNAIQGKVIKIKDGDTIDILFSGKPLTVRFDHIDCPEKKQPFGNAAKQFTAGKCFGQTVTIQNEKKYDRYKRLIGVVITPEGENVNEALVRAGLAWHYKKHSTNSRYAELETTAKKNKVGLWADINAVPPWEWRKPKSLK